MFNYRTLFLTIVCTCAMPIYSMQDCQNNIAQTEQGRRTPPYIVAIIDNYVKQLESQGKDINSPLTSGPDKDQTPLYVASKNGDIDLVDYYVKKLESQGKDINPPLTSGNEQGVTPLYVAAYAGRLDIVDYYVKKLESQGKDINPPLTSGLDSGWTPCLRATKRQHLNVVKTFVYRGASLADRDPTGRTAEEIASNNRNTGMARYLHTIAPLTRQLLSECIKVERLSASIEEMRNKFLTAAYKGMETASDLTTKAQRRQQALQALETIKLLLKQGADANSQGRDGYSPLHCLINYYNPGGPTAFDEAARELIDSGKVDLNLIADDGHTPLSLAAKFGNSRIFKYLIKKGANPRIGNNPIVVALENNQNAFWRNVFYGEK